MTTQETTQQFDHDAFQSGLERFVDNEVILNCSMLVSDLYRHGVMESENLEFENELYRDTEDIPYCEHCDCSDIDDLDTCDCEHEDCEHDIFDIDDIEPKFQEIFEYWFVGSMLYEDLKGIGAPVCDTPYGYIWGRTETGQSLTMDSKLRTVYMALFTRNRS